MAQARPQKIPVFHSVEELRSEIARHPNDRYCLYVASKTDAGWEESTSRVYLNQVSNRLHYLPVQVPEGSVGDSLLQQLYLLTINTPAIIAVNHSQPHKNNPRLRALFCKSIPPVIDTLVKDEHGEIVPYDFNGPSFVKWFTEDERKSFATRDVILVGVGGAGEAIARCVSHQSPNRLFLVDLTNKSDLVKELRADAHTTYCKTCDELIHNETLHNVLLINGTGHDGADSKGGESSLRALLDTHRRHDRLFVDLRPRLTVGLVEYAKKMGWESHSGFGMNARNDYEIWTKLVPHLREETMPFAAFRDLVREASG